MVAATAAQCDGSGAWTAKQYPNQLWVGGVMGVLLTLGNILRRRHASTPRYRPRIPSSDIQEGAEVARACAMAGVVRYIGRILS